MSVTLTAKQLQEALDFVAPDRATDPEQMKTKVTLSWMGARVSAKGDPMEAGYYLRLSDHPEEGVHGPLGQQGYPAPTVCD